MSEEWRDIPGWPQYQVSNLGCVRSLVGPGFAFKNKRKFMKIRKAYIGKDGYARVTLFENSHSEESRTETWTIHRLVAISFLGDRSSDGLDVAHLNGIKTDNFVENLKWVTRLENEHHKIAHGTKAVGIKNGQSKLNDRMVIAIRGLHLKDGVSQSVLAERFGVCQQAISAIINGRTWADALLAELAKPKERP